MNIAVKVLTPCMPKLKSIHGRKSTQMTNTLVSSPSLHLAKQPPAKAKSFYLLRYTGRSISAQAFLFQMLWFTANIYL